jgi:hypothetical protein
MEYSEARNTQSPPTESQTNQTESTPQLPPEVSAQELKQQRKILLAIGGFLVLMLAVLGISVWLLTLPTTDTARVRDIFIIMIAAMTLVLGFVLVLLVYQLARLINLLQNEIRPILESTNETSRTLRGTAVFLSEHLAEPVIKLNESLAAWQRLRDMLNPGRNRK